MFGHIYVEDKARDHAMTRRILDRFGDSTVIGIRHFKDVFNRPGQDVLIQGKDRSLILAVNDGKKIFEASPVCQDMGLGDFFYAESAMNCIFSCDYCFLKGMYGTSNVVIFVNSDDYLAECAQRLDKGPMYLCASFNTDLGALNGICEWQSIWEDFAASHPELTLELRSKSVIHDTRTEDNIIYAFTLSPEKIIKEFEKGTPSLDKRIESVNRALAKGSSVRLCFDPLIYIKDFELCYNEFAGKVIRDIDIIRVRDISIGSFRISSEYIAALRRASPDSSAVLYPFEKENGFCVYPSGIRSRLIGTLEKRFVEEGFGSKLYVMR